MTAIRERMPRPSAGLRQFWRSPIVLCSLATGVVAAGQGKPGLAATMFGRPLVRNLITSGPYQRAMGTPSYEPMLTPDSGLAAVMRGYLSGNMTQ
jgi:hypothetical protein